MTKEERIERLEKELVQLKEEIAAEKAEEEKAWPKMKDEYFWINGGGFVTSSVWRRLPGDHNVKCLGNIFRTREEAERMVLRLKARKKLLDAGGHEGVEGYRRGIKYRPFPHTDGGITIEHLTGVSAFDIWFKSREDCQSAIDNLTDEEKAALCWTGEKE